MACRHTFVLWTFWLGSLTYKSMCTRLANKACRQTDTAHVFKLQQSALKIWRANHAASSSTNTNTHCICHEGDGGTRTAELTMVRHATTARLTHPFLSVHIQCRYDRANTHQVRSQAQKTQDGSSFYRRFLQRKWQSALCRLWHESRFSQANDSTRYRKNIECSNR
jgi:hypothetical protein